MSSPAIQIPAWCRQLIATADRSPARAFALARSGGKAEDDPWRRFAEGWALLSWERLEAARAILRAGRDGFANSEGALGRLLCDYGLLLVDQRQLVRQQIDTELGALAGQLFASGEPHMARRAYLDQARQLNVLGRPRDSEALLRSLTLTKTSRRPLEQGRQLRVRAVAAYQQGDYQRAVVLLGKAERLFRKGRWHLELARCWLEQGALATYQERHKVALGYYERAMRVFDTCDLPLQRAFCLKSAGTVAIRQGRYDEALWRTRSALDLFQSLGRQQDVGACTMHLGNIYLHSGDLSAALGAYARAEELFARAGTLGLQIMVQRNRAMMYRAAGRLAEAATLLAEAERQATQIGLQAEVAEIWAAQAAVLAEEGRAEEAAYRYHAANTRFLDLGNCAAAAECQLELGWLALRANDFPAAKAHFAAASPWLLEQGHHLWRLRYGEGRCAALAGDPVAALQQYDAASTTLAGLRRRLVSESLSSRLYTQASRLHADALLLATAQSDPVAGLAFAEGQRALTLQQLIRRQSGPIRPADQRTQEALRQQIEALVNRKALDDGMLDGALKAYDQLLLRMRHERPDGPLPELPASALDLAQVRQVLSDGLGDDWTALVYVFVDGSLITLSLTSRESFVEAQADDSALRRLLAQASHPTYRYYIYNDLPFVHGQASEPWAGLSALGKRLIPSHLWPRLHGNHRLLIVPAGSLHSLPWAALRLDGTWLAEQAVVHLLPALSLVPALFERATTGTRALIIGCSSFGGRAANLPAVAAELEGIANCWPGIVTQRLDQEATRAALLNTAEALETVALLHIASHAQLVASHGLAAHLKLWDGDVLLPEIMALPLAGALVVLSACDGAAADVLPGEEVLSLTWGFLAGGAGAVIASLWPLNDSLGPAVMSAVYERLAVGDDPALALARAQRSLMRGEVGEGTGVPQVWAALQMIGGGRRFG